MKMMHQDGSEILTQGMNNWKLRLVLSALLSIIGLGFLVSMILGTTMELSVYDRSLVGIAIFMVGVPAYLILSNLAKVDEYTIAGFLNKHLEMAEGQAEVLLKEEEELQSEELSKRAELLNLFQEKPLYQFLPDQPIRQAYYLFVLSAAGSLLVWFLS